MTQEKFGVSFDGAHSWAFVANWRYCLTGYVEVMSKRCCETDLGKNSFWFEGHKDSCNISAHLEQAAALWGRSEKNGFRRFSQTFASSKDTQIKKGRVHVSSVWVLLYVTEWRCKGVTLGSSLKEETRLHECHSPKQSRSDENCNFCTIRSSSVP